MDEGEGDLRAAILDMALQRAARGAARGGTFCPSDVARRVSPGDWRGLMPRVRQVAAAMPEIMATQGGAEVRADAARGPIRLRLRVLAPRPGQE